MVIKDNFTLTADDFQLESCNVLVEINLIKAKSSFDCNGRYQSYVFAEVNHCFGYSISWVISCLFSDYINCTGGEWRDRDALSCRQC